ncbi:hypothetical protein [Deinococcus hopiensis]|uniref:Uncharacterized protein n=1 Tax=Deinococcus hopiensis KR-140 TaxID=695939 RepID=A0A1W1UYK5_9DEIO|nr:hypothetical protein [Deinococcus hopiensis]SMB85821.1 hypothetical protein SAMN00790413_03555 [Deinococcus hopiensis KR-140]
MPTPAEPLPADAVDLLVQEVRSRVTYRGLLLHASAELDTQRQLQEVQESLEDHDWRTDPEHERHLRQRVAALESQLAEQWTATAAQARRIVTTSRVPSEHRDQVTAALATHARLEVQRRPLRAAQLNRPPALRSALPEGPALTITPEQVTHTQREEQNAIARALVFPETTERDRGLGESADPLTQTLEEAHARLLSSDRLCRRYTLAGQDQLALHYALQAQTAETEYDRAHAQITAERRDTLKGRPYADGDTYHVHLPHPDGTGHHLIHLDVRYDASGLHLEVTGDSARRIERRTGIRAGTGWSSLARWIEDTHAALVEGRGGGRRPQGHAHLIWEWQHDTRLVLRRHLNRDYPGLIAALEAIRCALEPA